MPLQTNETSVNSVFFHPVTSFQNCQFSLQLCLSQNNVRLSKVLLNYLTSCEWTYIMIFDESLSWNKVNLSHCHIWRGNAMASFSNLVATRLWTKVSIMNRDLPIFIFTKRPKNLVAYFGLSYVNEKNFTIWVEHTSTVFLYIVLFFFVNFSSFLPVFSPTS